MVNGDMSVLEMLEQDIAAAYKEFAQSPTQSGRVRLRHKLMTLAGALDVEADQLDEANAVHLRIAIADLRALAEMVLVVPKESIITQEDTIVLLKPPKAVQRAAPRPFAWGKLLSIILRETTKLFKMK